MAAQSAEQFKSFLENVSLLVLSLFILYLLQLNLSEINKFQAPQPAIVTAKSSDNRKPQKTGYEFPAGGNQLLPAYRLVALYGSPGEPALGILGEQNEPASAQRIKKLADEYQKYSTEPIYPAYEIIATIAHAAPTADNDYSREVSVEKIRPWIENAKENGIYIILDLQPGRTDFLTQAKIYEGLLKEPNVGLALDPEWRLKPNQFHLRQTGSVSAAEVNQVSNWLADLAKQNNLPQKIFLLHQFKLMMISNREQLDTSREELAYLIQMDGQGSVGAKQETWRAVTANPPQNTFFGWKNFYKKDPVVLSAEQTMKIDPKPYYVSYQ